MLKDFRETEFSFKSTNNSPACQGETLQYYSGLRGCGKDIFDYIHNKRNLPFIKIRNSTIAKSVGCTIRTVQRWTSEFARMGLITKHREDIFDTNQYQDNVPQPISFMMWFNSLTEHEQDMYMTHGIVTKKKKTVTLQIETVTPIYNPFPTPIYLQTNPNPIARQARVRYARARTIQTDMGFGSALDGDGFGFLSEKERIRKERVLKGIAMLNQEQKNWVMANGHDPRVKEYVLSAKVKHLLITPTIEALTTLLRLDEREQLKLVAYSDEVLESIHQTVKGIVEGTIKSGPIKDRMGWFIYLANDYCKKHSLSPDWRWYFEIAKILGIEALQQGEEPKPLIVNQSQSNPKRDGKNKYTPRNQTEEQKRYYEPAESLAHSKALGERNDARKLAEAIANKDEDSIRRYTKTPIPFTDPVFGPLALHIAKAMMPAEERQRAIAEFEGNPAMEIPLRVLKHIEKTSVAQPKADDILIADETHVRNSDMNEGRPAAKSRENPFMDVGNSEMNEDRTVGNSDMDNEPPMTDYGNMEEIFDMSEVVI